MPRSDKLESAIVVVTLVSDCCIMRYYAAFHFHERGIFLPGHARNTAGEKSVPFGPDPALRGPARVHLESEVP